MRIVSELKGRVVVFVLVNVKNMSEGLNDS